MKKNATIKYLFEHTACFNYDKTNEPLIELIEGKGASQGKILLNNHVLLYVFKGSVEFTYHPLPGVLVLENQMLFVPVGSELSYTSSSDFRCFMFRLEDDLRLCDCFKGVMLKEISDTIVKDSPHVMDAHCTIRDFVIGLDYLTSQKLFCRIFFDLKRKELLYMFRAFYTKEELALFFYEGLYENVSFSCGVIRNYRRCYSVSALAEALHYTVSGFEKRFKKTFGVSPSKWLREQKAKDIYRDVCLCRLNFKEIADKYNFSSTSTFNDFYKTFFGETPGVTRRKQTNGLV